MSSNRVQPQPRRPKGTPVGGQWDRETGSGAAASLEQRSGQLMCGKKTFRLNAKDGSKPRKVELDVRLEDGPDGPRFAVSGSITTPAGRDITAGQCLDEIKRLLPDDPTVAGIHELWTKHHLNDLHAGTPEQEECLERYWTSPEGQKRLESSRRDYTADCTVLEHAGMLEYNGYRYGSSWLYREIPPDDVARIERLLGS